jgi:hypothetical protein
LAAHELRGSRERGGSLELVQLGRPLEVAQLGGPLEQHLLAAQLGGPLEQHLLVPHLLVPAVRRHGLPGNTLQLKVANAVGNLG